MKVSVRFEFSASHILPLVSGGCGRLHGHNYTLEVELDGPVDPKTGMVMDFDDLDALVRAEILEALDHTHLNDRFRTPTAEIMLIWMWRRLAPSCPHLATLRLHETSRYVATCEGDVPGFEIEGPE